MADKPPKKTTTKPDTKEQPKIKDIGKLSGSTKAAAELFKAEQEHRDTAKNILELTGNKAQRWRAAKVLKTTIGAGDFSQPRPITKEDLAILEKRIRELGNRVERGVTANEVLSFSRDKDKERAKKEIFTAVPLTIKGGIIHFITNASLQSKDTRHNVMIQLYDYEKVMQFGTPLQAAKTAAQGNLLIDCDCGRHQFWYRFIVTRMGANYGRAELGVPKIRNPMLTGIGCKHILRVMAELNSSIVIHKRIALAIEYDRKILADKTRRNQQKTIRLTEKEAKELSQKQNKNARAIKPKDNKLLTAAQAKKANKAFEKITPPAKKDRPMTDKQFEQWVKNTRLAAITPELKTAIEQVISAATLARQQQRGS